MTRGEIWKDFFKKTVLTVLIAGAPISAAILRRAFVRNLLDVKMVCSGFGSVDSGLMVLLSLSPE